MRGGRFGGWGSIINAPDEAPKVTWELLRRVMGYARPYHRHITGMLLIILLSTGTSLLTPWIMRDLIDTTIPSGDLNRLVWLSAALLMLPIIGGALNIANRRLNVHVGEGVTYDLRMALYSRLQRMSLRFFTNTKVGELMSRLNNDVVGAQNAISNVIVTIITNLIQATALLIVMLAMDWRLTLISVLMLPLFIMAARRLAGTLRNIARQQLESNAAMNAMMNETLNIGGALLVKLFGRRNEEIDRFKDRAAEVRDLGVSRAMWGSVFFVIIGLLSAVGTALVFGFGGYLVMIKAFTIGTIVAFSSYLNNLYSALQQLTNAPVDFASSLVSFERVFEVVDLPVEIADAPDAHTLEHIRGELIFEHVSFRYDTEGKNLLNQVSRPGQMDNITAALSGTVSAQSIQGGARRRARTTANNGANGQEGPRDDADERVAYTQARESALEDVSFHVAPGQLVALVGPSGAGKTTLTYLIPRLYDPTEGRILIDGHDLRKVTLDSLSEQIGMVTQETHLFHDTIQTNLLYARLNATQAEIEAAARAANIHDFIRDLPQGYATVVGERGYRLSGGEKQRIALARVILKDPRILILDEATSSLDSESEALIQEALKRVMAGRTSIVIAHRLSTILAADLILVMDRGQVVERGTHPELLELDGLYAHLYRTQFNRAPAVALETQP